MLFIVPFRKSLQAMLLVTHILLDYWDNVSANFLVLVFLLWKSLHGKTI